MIKHHGNYLKYLCEKGRSSENFREKFHSVIKPLRGTKTDLYSGNLEVEELFKKVMGQLLEKDKATEEEYKKWMKENGGFVIIKMKDDSSWVLRKGEQPGKFIHIHPARSSANTVRLSINKLQTLIVCGLYHSDSEELSIEKINRLRESKLELSRISRDRFNHGELKKMFRKIIINE